MRYASTDWFPARYLTRRRHQTTAGSATICALAFSLVASCSLLAACGGEPEPGPLTFISWQNDEPGIGDWWASVINEFEETHPGEDIQFTKVERAAFATTMTTLFAAGDPPDIVHLASFEYQRFAENEWMEDLAPWLERANLDVSDWPGQSVCTWKGETRCVILQYFGFVLGYNAEILEREGLSVPTTWDEFIVVARKATKDTNGDGIIDQFGVGHETRGGSGQYLTEMLNYILGAGAFWTNDLGEVTINTPEMAEGLRRWKTVVTENLTPRDYSSSDVRQLFSDGRIAMLFDGPWLEPTLTSGTAKNKLKIAPVPFDTPMGGSSSVIGIASEITPNRKQLAWDFIELAMSERLQSRFAVMARSVPSNPDAVLDDAYEATPHFSSFVEAHRRAAQNRTDRIPVGLELNYNEFSKMVKDEAQRMIIEDIDPAKVAITMHRKGLAIQRSQ